jgi:hypothetical protein
MGLKEPKRHEVFDLHLIFFIPQRFKHMKKYWLVLRVSIYHNMTYLTLILY